MEDCANVKVNNGTDNTSIYYGGLDVLKVILSFFVVAIHTGLFQPYLFPIVRLAVPLFFVISSFLFFSKIRKADGRNEENRIVVSFIKRNLLLYLFWFVVLLPVTIIAKRNSYFALPLGFVIFFKDLFLGSTFYASWFIMANLLCVLLVFVLKKKRVLLVLISSISFLACLFSSTYLFIFGSTNVYGIMSWINENINLGNTFFAGMLWSFIGYLFVTSGRFKTWSLTILSIFSLVTLLCEFFLLKIFVSSFLVESELFIGEIPSVVFIFLLFRNVVLSNPILPIMRKISSIVYCSHMSICVVLRKLFSYVEFQDFQNCCLFIITISLSVALALLVLFFSKKWRLFRIAY